MAAAVVLFLVVAVSATAGWVAAEINEPDAPAAPSPSTAPTPSTGSDEPMGSALKSVTAITVIREALHRLAPGSDLRARLPAGIDAAAVQVTVTNARRPGAVRLDAGAGPVDAVRVSSSGTTTSNLVVLPVATRTLSVRHGPGGGSRSEWSARSHPRPRSNGPDASCPGHPCGSPTSTPPRTAAS